MNTTTCTCSTYPVEHHIGWCGTLDWAEFETTILDEWTRETQ